MTKPLAHLITCLAWLSLATFSALPAWSQSFVSGNGVITQNGACEIAYNGSGTIDSTVTDPQSFASVPIGTASVNRYILIALGGGDDAGTAAAAIDSVNTTVTVGGAATDLIVLQQNATTANATVSLWVTQAPVTTGTTATVTITTFLETNMDNAQVLSYSLFPTGGGTWVFDWNQNRRTAADGNGAWDPVLILPATGDNSAGGNNQDYATSATGSLSADIDDNLIYSFGGCWVAAGIGLTEAANTWSGGFTANVVEDYDVDIGESQFTGAHGVITTAATVANSSFVAPSYTGMTTSLGTAGIVFGSARRGP